MQLECSALCIPKDNCKDFGDTGAHSAASFTSLFSTLNAVPFPLWHPPQHLFTKHMVSVWWSAFSPGSCHQLRHPYDYSPSQHLVFLHSVVLKFYGCKGFLSAHKYSLDIAITCRFRLISCKCPFLSSLIVISLKVWYDHFNIMLAHLTVANVYLNLNPSACWIWIARCPY